MSCAKKNSRSKNVDRAVGSSWVMRRKSRRIGVLWHALGGGVGGRVDRDLGKEFWMTLSKRKCGKLYDKKSTEFTR